ncbi:hypothetical protein B5F10_03135 [Anaerotruncus colihominis]|uniref:Methyl-accepting chemotaxis protein n=1 Tax=Anaerotruncus colihominis TaxID=169435 RepID=A0A1Y4N468_9FIRM|nr:hypothetical protein B5F11_01240 [Anaerotruncus colihominis]OUP75684.1 hypothetical protein B5F10_03135 [Anaerotruncus colihominis]
MGQMLKSMHEVGTLSCGSVGHLRQASGTVGRQTEAIAHITHEVGQISAGVRTNTDAADQNSRLSQHLASQAGSLKQMVNNFRLRQSENARHMGA